MTNAVLLGAGQGRRLAPLTDNRPKCLVEIAGRPLLEWQLMALAEAGVEEATIVTGFGAAAVETALAVIAPSIRVTCRHNPFFAVADNIGSCWVARDLFRDDTLLINGDTLFDPRIPARVLAEARAPVSVTIDAKDSYDVDDMKVQLDGDRLVHIGKKLEAPIHGESIGMLRFQGEGGPRFAATLDATLRDPAALSRWYLSVIDALAGEGGVGTVSIKGLPWAEVDYPHDLAIAAASVAAFEWGDAVAGPELAAAGRASSR
ncbi:MAG TPA: phosphocholine cytidylyltransferase family protein [Paracoccaceae bacterium]|nr:phosphocholine cytidylyltransferase family protein [Paracoccaceae bacterium]